MSQSKNWCLTLNNYTEQEMSTLLSELDVLLEEKKLHYYVIGKEVGAGGTPHLQGYVQFCSKKRLGGVKSSLKNERMHLEPQSTRSTPLQAADYCKKENEFFEKGELMSKGKRTDLKEIKDKIDNGASYVDLWDHDFSTMCIYRKAFMEYISLKRSAITRPVPKVFVFYGPTGTGKTRRAFEFCPESTWVYPGKGWFDGYAGHKVAIFDEFDGSDIDFALWKRLCDRYPMSVPVKGGYTPWYPEIIVFTSNVEPRAWWHVGVDRVILPHGAEEQRNRRVSFYAHMTEEYVPGNPWIDIERFQ